MNKLAPAVLVAVTLAGCSSAPATATSDQDLTFTLHVDGAARTLVANINGRRMSGELPTTCGVPANMTQITSEYRDPLTRVSRTELLDAAGSPFRCAAARDARGASCECPSGDVVALKIIQHR